MSENDLNQEQNANDANTLEGIQSPEPATAPVEDSKAQLTAANDKYLRLLAEFDNMRKRHERERAEIIKYAHEEVIVEFLGIYDDLKRSYQSTFNKTDVDPLAAQGLKLVIANLEKLLNKYDVKPIEAVGKPFDPNCMEVLMQQETTEQPDGTVLEVFETGYTLAGRFVRTAKVKVAKNIN